MCVVLFIWRVVFVCTVSFSCMVCTKVFKKRDALRKHKRTHALQKPVLLCPSQGCQAYFSTTFNLQHHIRKVHLKLLSHRCAFPSCSKAFAMRVSDAHRWCLCASDGLITTGLCVTVLSGKSGPSHVASWPWHGQVQGEAFRTREAAVETGLNPVDSLWLVADGLFGVRITRVFLSFSVDTCAAARVGRSVWRGTTVVLWLKMWVSSSLYAWTSVTKWNAKPIWRVSSMSARSRTASILKWTCEISSASNRLKPNRLKENEVSANTGFSTHANVDHLSFCMIIMAEEFLLKNISVMFCTWVQLFFIKWICLFSSTALWLNANKLLCLSVILFGFNVFWGCFEWLI